MSPRTATAMLGLLREVVSEGTATSADLATFEVAGKSGTARRTSNDGSGYLEGSYTASFVGLFPADKPQYVILVKLDNPSGGYYGGRTAAPVTKIVLEAAIAARDAALNRQQLSEAPKRRVPSPEPAADRARAAAAAEAAAEAEAELVAPGYVVELGTPVEPPRTVVTSRPVPDVHGMTTRAAVREMHRAGFRVQLVRGTTQEQQPVAGTMLRAGSLVRLSAER